jgi:hypothetical protein
MKNIFLAKMTFVFLMMFQQVCGMYSDTIDELFKAIELDNDTEITKILLTLEKSFGYLGSKREGDTTNNPLHVAARDGKINAVMAICNNKLGKTLVNERNTKHTLHKSPYRNITTEFDDPNQTPLHLAAENGHLDIVKLLKKIGAFFNLNDA